MHARTVVFGSITVLALLLGALWLLNRSAGHDHYAERLVLYCAAGIRVPVEAAIAEYKAYYEKTHGQSVRVEVHYGGSGTLLSQLRVSAAADLFLSGDVSYLHRGREQETVREIIPLAKMTPVIAVAAGQEGRVASLAGLLDGNLRYGIGTPDGPAIGQAARRAVERIGRLEALEQRAAVMKPTVNDLAMDVQIGAIDAAIVWDTTARQFELDFVTDPLLNEETVEVAIGVTAASTQPTAALHFARFLSAPEHGLPHFDAHHFETVEGDRWRDTPEVTFFSGGVNRRALEPILASFQEREGVRVNTVYGGCGALNAQLQTIRDQNPDLGFPDGYLLCDIYYLDPVGDWFERGTTVSSTPIVIVTAKDNPFGIERLEDLAQAGVRIVVGHPTHCTVGALTERLFKVKGVYDAIAPNIVERQPSSGLMVPPVVAGSADASLAYYTDTLPERDKLHVVHIDSEYAFAVQPFTVAHTSHHKHLMHRLYEFIGQSEEIYEALGFGWTLGGSPDEYEVVAPAGARPWQSD